MQVLNTALDAYPTGDLLPAVASAMARLKAAKARCALLAWVHRSADSGALAVPLPGSDMRWGRPVCSLSMTGT